MSKSEKRCWQTLAAIVGIIGFILLMTTILILSPLIPDYFCILFIILTLLLVVIGTTSWSILQFYY